MDEPLSTRRDIMLKTVGSDQQQLIASDGVIGPGRSFYEQVVGEQLEGVATAYLIAQLTKPPRESAKR